MDLSGARIRNPGQERTPPAPSTKKSRKRRGLTPGRIIGRIFLLLFVLLIIAVASLLAVCNTIANGPSVTMRDRLVLSAMQASATKWVPGLFLDKEVVDGIVAASHVSYTEPIPLDKAGGDSSYSFDTYSESENWINGVMYTTYSGATYRAYILFVKDPSRVFVGTPDLSGVRVGLRIYEMAEKYDALIAINAGEYVDPSPNPGSTPMGITYSKGELVWDDGLTNRTFIGIDKNNTLVLLEGITRAQSQELGIRDGVCFQTGNILLTYNEITNSITPNYQKSNTGVAQRTAIGQKLDGTMILVVTDGRSASSLGATHDDIINLMIELGAVRAGMLDGGSSTLMYYENYWDILEGFDYNSLDEYQKLGIINKYKAFTTPRKMPTYFLVSKTGN